MKHGALSESNGRVRLDGAIEGSTDTVLSLLWTESGGPPVSRPQKSGFGTQLISVAIGDSEVNMDYAPDGVQCRVRIPVGSLNV